MYTHSNVSKHSYRRIPIRVVNDSLHRDRMTAVVVLLIMIAMMTLIVWLASFSDPVQVPPFHGPMM